MLPLYRLPAGGTSTAWQPGELPAMLHGLMDVSSEN